MKKVFDRFSIIILTASVLLGSCSKNYLDQNPNSSVPAGQALNNISSLQDALNGTYAQLRSTSFLGRDLPITGDLMADNTYVETENSNL